MSNLSDEFDFSDAYEVVQATRNSHVATHEAIVLLDAWRSLMENETVIQQISGLPISEATKARTLHISYCARNGLLQNVSRAWEAYKAKHNEQDKQSAK